MTIKISLVAQRPDTSALFWWDTGTDVVNQSLTQANEAMTLFGITLTTELSEDQLTCTRAFIAPSLEVWDMFMALALAQPESLENRKSYFIQHGHTLSVTRVDLETQEVTGVIPDGLAHLTR